MDIFMLVYLISNHDSDKLGDSGKKKVCMERFLILGSASCNTETVLKVVDCLFNIYTDLVSVIPLGSTAGSAGICTQVLFRVDIKHTPAAGLCTGIFTMTDASALSGVFVIFPFHFGTYELHGWDTAPQM